jgi:hypothetical protein
LVQKPTTRRAIQTAIALGLGAGLATGDLQDLTRADITDLGEEGIRINVSGSRPAHRVAAPGLRRSAA